MARHKPKGLTRREFIKVAGAGALAAGVAGSLPSRARAQAPAPEKTLRIIQWSHFVPAYDKWFDGKFTKEWG
ncbi:MAG TPA: twin-arginine translocation signal domain-containing protein, partial [Anaeromyxobacteraceae bacterium]|nr:twin-arginine translocation signal domain-containing protein [Anaeromyxobacteraceae bacterium]